MKAIRKVVKNRRDRMKNGKNQIVPTLPKD